MLSSRFYISKKAGIPAFLIPLGILLAFLPTQTRAGCGDITGTRTSASYVTVDANDACGLSSTVPLTAYIGYSVCNTTGNDIQDISATFSVDASSSPNYTFSLSSGQAATQTFPYLQAGECNTFYWFVSYISTDCGRNANWHDGELLVFDISVDATDAVTSSPCSTTLFDNESIITNTQNAANAGGQVITQNLTSGDVIGAVTEICINYDFGNTVAGGELNLQPAGNQSFDASAFQLINSEVTYSEVGGVPVGTQNQLGFICDGTSADGADANTSVGDIIVCYYFTTLQLNASTTALPYSDTRSGGIHKYTGNFASQPVINIPAVTASPSITKSASPNSFITNGQTITYTVQICNPSETSDLSVDRVVDVLPAGFTFQGLVAGTSASISAAPVKPGTGDVGTLTWEDGSPSMVFPYTDFLLVKKPDPATPSCLTLVYEATAPMDIELDDSPRTNTVSYEVGAVSSSASASVTSGAPLPVELLDFKAKWAGDAASLLWKSASEVNTSHFMVEKMDLVTDRFLPVGHVEAAGNSTQVREYSFLDERADNRNYYRLKMVDLDGSYEYSPIVGLERASTQLEIQAFPNPTKGAFSLQFNSPWEQDGILLIADINGKRVHQSSIFLQKGWGVTTLDLDDLHSGNYVCSIITDDKVVSTRLTVINEN